MDIQEAVLQFLVFSQVEKGLSKRTVDEYRRDLEGFYQFLLQKAGDEPIEVAHVQLTDIRSYLLHMMEAGFKASTRRRKSITIRQFLDFLVEEGVLEKNPAERIKMPKRPQNLPIFLTLEEAKRFMAVLETHKHEHVRDYTIITLFLHTGMRLSELTGLNVADLDLDARAIRVLGKGNKERLLPVDDKLRTVLAAYLQERPDNSQPALFQTLYKGGYKRITTRTVQKKVAKMLGESGIDKAISPHKLRHTFATLLHEAGVDLIEIQALLGHANITMTQIYTHTSTRKLKQAVDKNPLGEDGGE